MQIITDHSNKELKQHGSEAFPFLVSPERLSGYESGSFLWHWHPEIELTYIEKGCMLYKVNRFTFELHAGDVLFGNANVLHAGTMLGGQDCEYQSITFSPKLIYGFAKSAIYTQYVESIIRDFSFSALHIDGSMTWHKDFVRQVLQLIKLDRTKPVCYELEVVTLLQLLWKSIFLNRPVTSSYTLHDTKEYQRIREMVSYVELNYMHKITLQDISAHINLCESECSRLFKRYMNLSLFSFLQEYRIDRSLEYLSGDHSISDIAQKVGFSDSNYYSKVFTKLKGISPQKYRRTWSGN